jgi:hypothetical protein
MTPVRTAGNLRGSRMESVIGITYSEPGLCKYTGKMQGKIFTRPIPSNENTAVLEGFIRMLVFELETQPNRSRLTQSKAESPSN